MKNGGVKALSFVRIDITRVSTRIAKAYTIRQRMSKTGERATRLRFAKGYRYRKVISASVGIMMALM
jgi:hypothetical protein